MIFVYILEGDKESKKNQIPSSYCIQLLTIIKLQHSYKFMVALLFQGGTKNKF